MRTASIEVTMALLEQFAGLFLMLALLALGWWRWIAPYRAHLNNQGLGLLVLAVLTVVGGLVGSPFWWIDDPNSFSWALPPLAGRLLGAAGFAFAITGCYALEQRKQQLIRSYIVMLAVYLAPLVAAILLFHLDRFDWRAPITYAFFVVAGGMAVAALWHLGRGTTLSKDFQDAIVQRVPSAMRTWLWFVAIVSGAWGAAMFIYPSGPWPQIWVWPQDPLTSRLIATMLLTLCAAALVAIQSVAQARMSLWMFVAYGFLAALGCIQNLVAAKPVPIAYAAFFCALGAISAAFLFVGPKASRA
jgi:hypothetical protein